MLLRDQARGLLAANFFCPGAVLGHLGRVPAPSLRSGIVLAALDTPAGVARHGEALRGAGLRCGEKLQDAVEVPGDVRPVAQLVPPHRVDGLDVVP
jgi:hypothetical protein